MRGDVPRCLGKFARWFPQVVPGAGSEIAMARQRKGAPATASADPSLRKRVGPWRLSEYPNCGLITTIQECLGRPGHLPRSARRSAPGVIPADAQCYGRQSWDRAYDHSLGCGEHRYRPRDSGERHVGRALDVAVYQRRVWTFEHALGDHDHGQVWDGSTSQDVPSPPSQPNAPLS